MFATVRRYDDLSPLLLGLVASGVAGIGAVLESVPGWISCLLIRTRDGVILVTVGDDEASLVESGRRLSAWLAQQTRDVPQASPDVWAGDVLLTATAPAGPPRHPAHP